MQRRRGALFAVAIVLIAGGSAHADGMLTDFSYPHPMKQHAFTSQGQALVMAYMDVPPSATANGKTAILFHGKNFCGATWEGVITPLAAAGYRVVVPDQIGFCKSTKPATYQMSFHQLAANTRALLASLGVTRPILIGHSMGGMLATRYALSFPDDKAALVLVNPIGLEDWSAKGVPGRTVDELLEAERKTDAARIKAYQQKTYYDGRWRPEFDRWVEMLASTYRGTDSELAILSQARASDMIFTQPVVHEFTRLAVPVVLLIGERDTTAIGKDRAPPEVAAKLGHYAELAREAESRIPNARLVTFPELGHAPHIEEPDAFNTVLLETLAGLSTP
ncbi:alpha/beta hydrolase [Hyphomicrobium sp.]|uniref:alpha/beta fold hydrolase n=1 Tax=Hyphomicrobium sp. TaxID=82 RepID=UPI0025C21C57|nr:alpha/beta hydrolase [Hyphomicrobium sp.]MCC7251221.1 alpha/beta hydrolase [Hyphomicrobium sp.]